MILDDDLLGHLLQLGLCRPIQVLTIDELNPSHILSSCIGKHETITITQEEEDACVSAG